MIRYCALKEGFVENSTMKRLHLTSLTVTRRRRVRTFRRSGSRPDTAALSGCRPSLSPCWELFQKTTTAARPSSSSTSYTGPWRDTGRTDTRTVNKQPHRNKLYDGTLIPDENMDSKVRLVNLGKLQTHTHTHSRGRWTHHVDDLRAGVSVLLHGLAGAVVLSFTHQQHLLWVVDCQAHLHMFNTSFDFLKGEPAYSSNKWWSIKTQSMKNAYKRQQISSFLLLPCLSFIYSNVWWLGLVLYFLLHLFYRFILRCHCYFPYSR